MGMSIGVLCMGRLRSWRRRAAFLAVFVFLANIPDLQLPNWGHDRYRVSHSLFVNLAIIVGLAVVIGLWPRVRRAIGGWRVFAFGSAAWLSHLLLDSFYNHGKGLAIYWPISRARLVLPMPWFSVLHGGWSFDLNTLRIIGIEVIFYGGILAMCLVGRWCYFNRRRSTPIALH